MKGMQKISRGNGFKGVLSYAFGGENREPGHGRLICGNLASTGINSMATEFRRIAARRPDIAKPVWHNSLRMPAGEDVSDERWEAIAKSYLKRMGFDLKNTQFILVKHPDQHVHLIVNRVLIDGTVFLGQNENLKSTRVIGDLEKAFRLTLTPGPTYDADGKIVMPEKSGLKKAEIEQALRTGTEPARLVLQKKVARAMQGRPMMAVFLQRLDAAGVITIPNIAATGTFNGFSFDWQGVAFSGSKLGAAYKWAAIEKEIIYVKESDGPELARRQAETRNRRPAHPGAGPDAEPVGPDPGSQEPVAGPDAGFAAPDLPIGGCDPATRPSDERDGTAAAVPADAGIGPETQGDRVNVAAQQGGAINAVGQSGNRADSAQGNQGSEGKLDRIKAAGVFQEIGQLAVRHDQEIKIQAWRVQAQALDASAYRLTLKDRLCPLGHERIDPIGQGQHGQAAPTYKSNQIEALIPKLRLSNQRGFDVYLTPIDLEKHYLVVQGVTPERLVTMRAQGYTPALVQGSGDDEQQAVIKVPRSVGRKDEQELANAIEADINQRFGGGGHLMVGSKALPMAGFICHKPKKMGLVTVVLEAIGQLCRRTFDRMATLRRKWDQAQEDEQRARQRELEKALLARKLVQFELDVQMYCRYATNVPSESPDQLDDVVALAMLKDGYLEDQVLAVLRTSSQLEGRHPDIDLYLHGLMQRAQDVWATELDTTQNLQRRDRSSSSPSMGG